MKLNRLETHDRYQHLIKDQGDVIGQGASDCLLKNSRSLKLQARSSYIYIFGHARTADDGVNKRILWQPRLTKPSAQINSFLFRAKSNTDILETCWILPPKETWDQYKKGNVTESQVVLWSISQFVHKRADLEKPFPDDVSQEQFDNIMREVKREEREESIIKKLYPKQEKKYQNV
jgi:hypothetical protein